jgi:NitT/TauT family transport system permease protein
MKIFRRHVLPPLVVLAALTALAEGIVYLRWVPAWLLPPPSAVAAVAWEQRSELGWGLLYTAEATVGGFLLSAVGGLAAAVVLSTSPLVQRAFYPYTVFFQTVPIVAVAPLLVLWFGFGENTVLASALIVSIFPVIANTLAGLLSTDPALVDMFRLYRAGRLATLFKLRLPAALPNIMVGLRIAAGLAVIGAIVGEFVAGSLNHKGLGVLMTESRRLLRTDMVFTAILAASLLGLVLFGAVNLLSWLLLRRWHAAEQSE